MAKKEELFGKFNIKDYNNQLEEILETKNFSSDTKNFLLSMLYKIETAYNDYSTVKSLGKTKGEFIEEILEIIKNNCEKIELIKPLDKKYNDFINKTEKCIVDKEKKQIITLYNEQLLLYALSKLSNDFNKFENEVTKVPLEELLSNGKSINTKEAIRDFDGWSWHIEKNLIENTETNLVYQNILMLIGDNFKTEVQIKEELENIYEKEIAEKIYILICKIAMLMYLNNHNKEKKTYKEIKLKNQEQLDKMLDKANYLKAITADRKKVETRIKTIDKCLNNASFLKKEYIKTNEKLKENEKIFSISDYADIIQNYKNIIKKCYQKPIYKKNSN